MENKLHVPNHQPVAILGAPSCTSVGMLDVLSSMSRWCNGDAKTGSVPYLYQVSFTVHTSSYIHHLVWYKMGPIL